MPMSIREKRRGDFLISTDKSKLDVALIHAFLSEEAYWSLGRTREMVQRTIEHSLCFGVYENDVQVGFCRVVTDYATFGWLCDVFILPSHRGKGLSKWLIEFVVADPALQGLRRFLLATRDAHDLYRRYGGFEPLTEPWRWMIRTAK